MTLLPFPPLRHSLSGERVLFGLFSRQSLDALNQKRLPRSHRSLAMTKKTLRHSLGGNEAVKEDLRLMEVEKFLSGPDLDIQHIFPGRENADELLVIRTGRMVSHIEV